MRSGRLRVQQVDPAELPPGEFAQLVRDGVEKEGARVLVIDSLNGYVNAMPQERHLALHLHELLSYLNQLGVATIMVLAQHGTLGSNMGSPVELSYLADSILLLRYFESDGAIRVAGSVLKRRGGNHERTLRELKLGPDGLRVGPPLQGFRGILTGVPVHTGRDDELMKPGLE
jgi:circadian clock protein KaiC